MYSSQVFVQLTCKGDDTYAEACSDNSKEKVMFHFDWDISQKDIWNMPGIDFEINI